MCDCSADFVSCSCLILFFHVGSEYRCLWGRGNSGPFSCDVMMTFMEILVTVVLSAVD